MDNKKLIKSEEERVLELRRRFAEQRSKKYELVKEELDNNKKTLEELEKKAQKSEAYINRAAKGKATRIKNLENYILDFESKDETNTTDEDRVKAYKNYIEYTRKTAPNYVSKRKSKKKSHAQIYEEIKKQIEELCKN